MNTSGGCARSIVIRRLRLFAEFLDVGFNFQRQARNRQAFGFHARRLGKKRIRFPLHFLQKKIEFLPVSPAPASNFSNCSTWLRSRASSSLTSLRSASSAAS